MGSEVIAKCDCGFEDYFSIGGGMMNFTTTCHFPCLCSGCQRVVDANLLSKNPKCPKCGSTDIIPYDDPRLLGSKGKRTVAEWNVEESLGRDLVLTNGSYKCPNCNNMALTFIDSGLCWD